MTEHIDAAYIAYIRDQESYWNSRGNLDAEDGLNDADAYYSMNQEDFTRYYQRNYQEEIAA